MARRPEGLWVVVAGLMASCLSASVLANGGPFVLKYPSGDPAAKGVLARLDPSLKPARESRLRVVREDLRIAFTTGASWTHADDGGRPLADVTAAYLIENPTPKPVTIDFGFPVLRGIYISPFSMMPRPDVAVTLDDVHVPAMVISNSAIYGLIRRQAQAAIAAGIRADARLSELVRRASGSDGAARADARARLARCLAESGWQERDAALMVEYAMLDLQGSASEPPDRDRGVLWGNPGSPELLALLGDDLGPLSAIGEQKATQFLAYLASRFDEEAGQGYEAIFEAWGGDVRERSIDLRTGRVRPREIEAVETAGEAARLDPTVYARVDYLDENAPITEEQKRSCRTILKNLPVIFTFAPMNLIHYRVEFPAGSTKTLTVRYKQYAFEDTAEPASYQLAYVVHPASLWDGFGPISLEVGVPEGTRLHATVPLRRAGQREWAGADGGKHRLATYSGTVEEKTGELLVAVDRASWERTKIARSAGKAQQQQVASR